MTEPTTNTTEPAKTDDVEDFADRLVRLAQRRRHEQVQSKNQNLRAQMAAHEEKPAPVENTAYPEQWFNDWLQAGFAETCGRRRTMEDAHCLEAKFRPSQKEQVFVGVYDGHGGKEAADMVGTELHTIFKTKLQQYDELVQLLRDIGDEPDQTILDRVKTANRELVPRLSQLILVDNNRNEIKKVQQQESVHQLLGAQEEKKQSSDDAFEKETSVAPIEIYNMNERQAIPLLLRESFLECNERVCETIRSGATASVAYFKDDTCYVANVGDSRIITIDSAGEIKRLTVDHRPDSSDEERRVKDAGGFIANKRVNAVLAVTRALGDADLHPYVSSDPYTSTVAVRPGQLFIIACDGVWDFVKDEQAYELIKDEKDARKASVMLRDFAYQQGSTDNISVIVVRVL